MERFWMTTRGLEPNDVGAWVRYADAQRALDAERERVKELEEQLRLANCDQVNTENDLNDVTAQLATLQAQLRQVEADRQTLRQLVEALPVVDGRMDVECGACYYIHSFVAGQYGVVCGLITEQSTAMAIKTLLEYRATLAAQDAGKVSTSIIGKQVLPSQWNKNAGVSCDVS